MSNFKERSDDAKKIVHKGKDKAESLAHQFTEGTANLYEEGKRKVCDVEESISEHTDVLISKVKEKPITSLLIAGGIGFLLFHLLKK